MMSDETAPAVPWFFRGELVRGTPLGAGYYLFGASWEALLAQYDVSRGEMWLLVLITMLMAPVAAAFGHHLIGRHRFISSPRKARFRR